VALPFNAAHMPAERIGRQRAQVATNVRARAYVEEALGRLSCGTTAAPEPPPPSTSEDLGDVAAIARGEVSWSSSPTITPTCGNMCKGFFVLGASEWRR
jgi:hypothetical protein